MDTGIEEQSSRVPAAGGRRWVGLMASFVAVTVLVVTGGAVAIGMQLAAAERTTIAQAEHVAQVIAQIVPSVGDGGGAPIAGGGPPSLERIMALLRDGLRWDVIITDQDKRILAGAAPGAIGTVFDRDTANEVGHTIADGRTRTFVERSVDYPAGIRKVVVPLRRSAGTAPGAVVLEYTPLYRELLDEAWVLVWIVAAATTAGALLTLGGGAYVVRRGARAERALRAERRFRALLERSHEAILLGMADGTLSYVSSSVHSVLGYDPQAVKNQRTTDYMHPDDVPAALEARADVQRVPGGSITRVCRMRHADGAWRWIEYTTTNRLQDPDVGAFVINFRDVTTRKQGHDALRFQAQLLDAVGQPVIATGLDGRITYWNRAAEGLYGWAASAVVGRHLVDVIFAPADQARGLATMADLQRGEARTREVSGRRRDGTTFFVLVTCTPVRDEHGQTVGLIGVSLDLTDRKRFEAELGAARDVALAASQAKSEFLANMSHEIRTPMNAILGMADLLAETPLTEEQQEYVGIFRRAGDTLLSLIDDILDLSKVEAGQLTLEATEFAIRELVEDTVEVLAARAHAKGLELTCEIAPDVPPRVVGDPQRLRQVLLNLLGNAVKFTARGEVNLRLERQGLAPNTPEDQGPPAETLLAAPVALRFVVRDTGIGIPPEQLGAVFGAFTQVDASTTRRFGGTGLGLAIVERLVVLMGGRIEVESLPGQGTTFSFGLSLEPVTAAGPAEPPASPVAELVGAGVLVVDDNATNRLVLRRLLEWQGVRVTEADGGEAGLAALRAARLTGVPYDLLLLDQQMPDLDGFQLLTRVRAEAPNGTAGEAVARAILMLSSDQRVGDATRARALGITHYLVKPIKRAALLATIATTLRRQAALPEVSVPDTAVPTGAVAPPPGVMAASPGTGPAPASATPQRLRLLLVDDSADNRRLVELYLSRLPYVLELAPDGQAGLAAFQAGDYDLVLMDVHMPVMDGLAATRALRVWELQQGRTPTPVLALTASAMADDVREALHAGCNAHLAKPLKKAALLAALARHTG